MKNISRPSLVSKGAGSSEGCPFCVVSGFVSVVQVPAGPAKPAEPAEPGPIRLLPEWLGQKAK
jgi:hypothetical protein